MSVTATFAMNGPFTCPFCNNCFHQEEETIKKVMNLGITYAVKLLHQDQHTSI